MRLPKPVFKRAKPKKKAGINTHIAELVYPIVMAARGNLKMRHPAIKRIPPAI